MMKIPHSQWVIEKVFFDAKPVEDFESKYLLWLAEYDCSDAVDDEAIAFAERIGSLELIQLYQWPFDHNSNNCMTVSYEDQADYFELEDDNQAIPRHLFELVD